MPFSGSGTGIQNADDVFFSGLSDGETLLYNSGTAKWVNSSVGSAADAVLTVAASDTPASLKGNADYVCSGTDDDVEIQQAIDLVAQNSSGGGEVVLLQGTYDISSTISVSHPSDSGTFRIHLRFERGAKIRWTSVTGTTPLIKIESSDVLVTNPWVEGSGTKGNGYGIVFGGDTTNFGGRYTKTVYRSCVKNPYCSRLTAGIVFAVDRTGSSSSGDNSVFGGYISSCQDGILSAGFTNRVYGITVATCDNCLHATSDRRSHMIEVFGATFNQWANACVYLERDKGSTFINLWAEHTAVQSGVPQQAILLGGTTDSSYCAHNTRFLGTTTLHLHDETYAVRHIRSEGVEFENISFSTNGSLPATSFIRQDADFSGSATYERITFQTGSVPAGWDYSMLMDVDAAATGTIVCKAIPAPGGSDTNKTVGENTPAPSGATYYVDMYGTPNSAIYWAKAQNGHIAMMSGDTATTSGLKAVLETLATDDVHFRFGPKRYHFLDAPVGNESFAGSEDHASYGQAATPTTGLEFSGSGMKNTIISSRTNWSGTADVEPFSFTNCQYVAIRDMTIEACGSLKTTTDAIDFDQGSNNLVERVRITRSRARAIVADGGDNGKHATNNVVRNCIIQGRPAKPGLVLISGGSLSSGTTYRYAVSWVDSDLTGAQTPGETKPSEVASITPSGSTLSVRVNIQIGPYSTTARKIYRAPAGSSSWVLVATVNDNTTNTYTDTGGAGSAVTMPVSHGSTILTSGIEMLGASGNTISNNVIDGVGDMTVGTNQYGINLVRKGSGATTVNSNQNIVMGNTIRQSGSYGIRILGGSDNNISNNIVINPGTVATKAQCIRIDNATSAITNNNIINSNRCIEDQDANSWSTGKTTSNIITVTATDNPTNNRITNNVLDAGASAARIANSGTTSFIKDNSGYNPVGASAVSVGASPYTYTAGASAEALYITGGTVSAIVKNAVTVFTSTPATIFLEPNESLTVTYSSAPTMNKDVK